jgi:hypothetical protein
MRVLSTYVVPKRLEQRAEKQACCISCRYTQVVRYEQGSQSKPVTGWRPPPA